LAPAAAARRAHLFPRLQRRPRGALRQVLGAGGTTVKRRCGGEATPSGGSAHSNRFNAALAGPFFRRPALTIRINALEPCACGEQLDPVNYLTKVREWMRSKCAACAASIARSVRGSARSRTIFSI